MERPVTSLEVSPNDSHYQSLMVLQTFHDLFFGPEGFSHLAKFANIITTKWTLLFFLEPTIHPLAIVLALRILARLLRFQNASYSLKFRNAADGFRILRVLLPFFWNVKPVMTTLFAILTGQDVAFLPMDASLDPDTLLAGHRKPTDNATHTLPVILACLRQGLQLSSYETLPSSLVSYLTQIATTLLAITRDLHGYTVIFQEHLREIASIVMPLCIITDHHPASGPFPLVSTSQDHQVPTEPEPSLTGLNIRGVGGKIEEPERMSVGSDEAASQDEVAKLAQTLLDCLVQRVTSNPKAVIALLDSPSFSDFRQEVCISIRATRTAKVLTRIL